MFMDERANPALLQAMKEPAPRPLRGIPGEHVIYQDPAITEWQARMEHRAQLQAGLRERLGDPSRPRNACRYSNAHELDAIWK